MVSVSLNWRENAKTAPYVRESLTEAEDSPEAVMDGAMRKFQSSPKDLA